MPHTAQSSLIASQRMRIAYLLTAVGGYLDAYTYVERGGVFANAQTGNIVKMGIALATHSGEKCPFYLIPMGAFVAGLIVSLTIKGILDRRGIRLVRRSVLAVEAIGLIVVGFIPLVPAWDIVANSIVSFVAAMQYETFTTFRGDAIVTTMSTGNLKKMVDAFYAGITKRDTKELARAGRFLSIVLTFSFGAYVGTVGCDILEGWAVLPAVAALPVAILTITILRRRQGHETMRRWRVRARK